MELALLFFLFASLIMSVACRQTGISCYYHHHLALMYDIALSIAAVVLIFLLHQAETPINEDMNSGMQIAVRVLRLLLFSNRVVFLSAKVTEERGGNSSITMVKLREEIKYVQNKVREQMASLEKNACTKTGINFNETVELCLNKNFK